MATLVCVQAATAIFAYAFLRGQIIERGTHEELLAARGFYYELYTSQFRRDIDFTEAPRPDVFDAMRASPARIDLTPGVDGMVWVSASH